jgi:hypothetical protein
MKNVVMRSIGGTGLCLGLAYAALSACASENLTTSGLDPESSDTLGNSPGSTSTGSPDDPGPSNTNPASTSTADAPRPDMMMTTPTATATGTTETPPPGSTGTTAPTATETPPTPPVLTPEAIGGDLDGFLYTGPCSGPDPDHDCPVPGCQGGTKTDQRMLQLGGEQGKIYDLGIHVYGVAETRVYQGGTRRPGNTFNVNGTDFFHIGGQVPAATGTYNTYELHVEPPVTNAVANSYFLNSSVGNDRQLVVRLDYTATIRVPGAGRIRWRSFDSNCRQITNCRIQACGPLLPKPLEVDISAAVPQPVGFDQPNITNANFGIGQWILIDVTSVAEVVP